MASTTETGHAKNVANFEDLIGFCTAYGATYNPSKASLKLGALNTLKANAQAALQTVKTAKTNYDNATNAREVAFKQLKPLATKIISALAATEATEQTLADAKTANNKIQGRRATKTKETTTNTSSGNATTTKTISTSQQSFDNLVDHFAQLITTLSAEPSYTPNENELSLAGLNAYLADLRAKNTAVVNANATFSNARINRNTILYDASTGLLEVAKDVKLYIKSLYGTASPQYKQVSALKFTNLGVL
jgi:hypothetical protein